MSGSRVLRNWARLLPAMFVGALGWHALAAPGGGESAGGVPAPSTPKSVGESPSRDELVFFEAKIRPLLIEHCYKCHSVKSDKLKGSLYVDGRDGLIHGGDSGPAIVPGDPEKSRLIESVRYGDEETAMPPKGKLPDAAIKDLEQWVRMGAPWPDEAKVAVTKTGPDYEKLRREHWAYQPIADAKPPTVKNAAWSAGAIDRFVLAKLEANQLKPAPQADRTTLARRLYIDLVGLPPTPEEIDAFLQDGSPQAYEKLVDQLLASPAYGERWGRHWLDVARYAESLTLRGFVLKDAWRYRDYVIESFNADRPFDVFMQEQVAGDLMPNDDLEQRRRAATGTSFLALGNNNLEEQDKKQLRMDVVDEQLDTIGKAFLAQTIGCARCHDHKFDPIPTKDYYALAGILRSTKTLEKSNVSKWLEVPLPDDAQREAEYRKHQEDVAALTARIKSAKAAIVRAQKGKDTDALPKGASPKVIPVVELPGVVVDDDQARKVGEWKFVQLAATYIGTGYVHDMNEDKGKKSLTFQPEMPHAGKYEVRLAYSAGKNRAPRVPVTVFSADGEKVIEINQQEIPPIDDRWVSLGQHTFEKNSAGFVMVSNEGTKGHVIADAVQFIPVEELAKAPAAPAAPEAVGPSTDAATRVKAMEAELKKLTAAVPARPTVVSIVEEIGPEIGDTFVHIRGSVGNLGPQVPRGYLSAVNVKSPPPIPQGQSGRRELALWLAASDNPLPARVMANRVWHWLNGQGICRTVDNFGTTGEQPSHPELLDYLAKRLGSQNWSVKKLVREIVLSETYRQAFVQNDKAAAVDPENRLYWRAGRKRLDGETIRDSMLAIADNLDRTAGGPTFKPGTTADYNYKHIDNRRSVYGAAFRNSPGEIVDAFDPADPSMVTGRRGVSTVAPQALLLMNHPFVREQAAATAAKLLDEGPTDPAARVEQAYRRVLGRLPSESERKLVLAYVNDVDAADKKAEVQAWTDIVHGLFASIDFRYAN